MLQILIRKDLFGSLQIDYNPYTLFAYKLKIVYMRLLKCN